MNKILSTILIGILLTESACADEAEKYFAVHVLPLLKTKCFACHGGDPDDIKKELSLMFTFKPVALAERVSGRNPCMAERLARKTARKYVRFWYLF